MCIRDRLEKARDIIAQRVDSNGVAEAEVSTQGGRNIVISIPGQPDAKTVSYTHLDVYKRQGGMPCASWASTRA